MTEREITERVRRLKDDLANQTADIARREATRLGVMRELRAYRVPLREIAALAEINPQTVTNRLTAAAKSAPKEQS